MAFMNKSLLEYFDEKLIYFQNFCLWYYFWARISSGWMFCFQWFAPPSAPTPMLTRSRLPKKLSGNNGSCCKTSGDRAMQLMTVSAAARHLGYRSRSQLYKLMNDGWLDAHVHVQMPSGQRLLDVDGLQKTLQGLCQWRVDSVFLRPH